jgi:hypothetical protein
VAGLAAGDQRSDAASSDESPVLVRAIVVSPPLPGAGDRVLSAEAQREFW